MNIQRILCPVNLSDGSFAALDYASRLAAQRGATLDIVYVDENGPNYAPGCGGYGFLLSGDRLRDIYERHALNKIKPTVAGVLCLRHCLKGQAAEVLVGFAEREPIDLIVIGSHGRSGIRRLVMGSVAESVLRRALCPVLIVKHTAVAETTSSTCADGGRKQTSTLVSGGVE